MTFTSAFARFDARLVLLIGSSAAALAMLRRLIRAGARVRWFPCDLDVAEELWLSGEPHQIQIAFREPRAIDFEEAAAVIATIGEPIVFQVSEQARRAGSRSPYWGARRLSTFNVELNVDDNSQRQTLQRPRPNATRWHHPSMWLSLHTARAKRFLSSLACALTHE